MANFCSIEYHIPCRIVNAFGTRLGQKARFARHGSAASYNASTTYLTRASSFPPGGTMVMPETSLKPLV